MSNPRDVRARFAGRLTTGMALTTGGAGGALRLAGAVRGFSLIESPRSGGHELGWQRS